jgi:hypothetical protein
VELAAKAEAQSEPTIGPSEEAKPARKIAEVNVAASTSIEHEASIVRRNSVAASQDSNAEVGPEQPPLPRKHGRALPE